MELDITALNNTDKLDINEEFSLPRELYSDYQIIDLKNLKLVGNLYIDSFSIITLKATLSGTMILEDSISLEPIEHNFSTEINEKIEETNEKFENTLDITDILWQNIMLEVPLKLTNVENFNEYQGDGWKLISEDSISNTNNPFRELKDMMGEE